VEEAALRIQHPHNPSQMGIGDVVETVNWAPVRRSSMSGAAARPSLHLQDDEMKALESIGIDRWRALAERAVEPNGYYLADWELAVNATARARTDAAALTVHESSSGKCRTGALIGLMPVISAWRAFRIPLPALVSADPYGTLCTPLLDRDGPEAAAAALLREARAAGQHALILRNVALDGATMKAFTAALERDGLKPQTLQAHASA
jgi:hypothetical protein